jgi:hypothetical protein
LDFEEVAGRTTTVKELYDGCLLDIRNGSTEELSGVQQLQ